MKISIFCVGGTIDKVYFDAKSKYEVGAPAVGRILREMKANLDYEVVSLMAKDSLEMSDDDRAMIARAVAESAQDKIIITHGTDTMVATAKQLQKVAGKTIVLTGALAPAIFKDSDAAFNIGCALATVQCAGHGVYISMNGKVFDADKVRKDVEQNRFIEV